jgi:hypothetical protein
MVKIPCLCPTTGSAETVYKRFLLQSLRKTPISQLFFNGGGFRTFLRSGSRLVLSPQQPGFQQELGFASFIGFKHSIDALPIDTACSGLVH